MSTVARNAVKKGIVNGEGFLQHNSVPVADGTSHINQGDLVYYDTSAHIAKPADTDAHCATLLGIALKSSIVNSNLDSSALSLPAIDVGFGVVASLKTTAAETYHHGDLLYIGADAQTVTNSNASGASTHPVGCVQLPAGVATVTGAAGVSIDVLVYSNELVQFHG